MKKNALVSLYNKNDLEYLCSTLQKFNINIISTGQTSVFIKKIGFKCTELSKITNFKEILNGRVKTLHPVVFSSILFNRNNKKHQNQIKLLKYPIIDFVIVNLYPFSDLNKEYNNFEDHIEMIDVGGVSLLRAAAKNFDSVTAVTKIEDYKSLKKNLISNNGKTSLDFRKKMASKVYKITSLYDNEIANWLDKKDKESFLINEKYKSKLSYGENPHQQSFYLSSTKSSIANNKIQGKKLSHNNILDISSALECINDFESPTCVIIKHNNPCGVASNSDINKAFLLAKECDEESSFGGIVAFNKSINLNLSKVIVKNFFQIIIAPDFSKDSIKILSKKPNLIIIKSKNIKRNNQQDVRSIYGGGYLFQNKNNVKINKKDIKNVSNIKNNAQILNDLIFAFKVCKHVKSNAIVLASNSQTIGIGAGQMSRFDSTKIAINKMKKTHNNQYFVAASDAFFPFVDNIKILIKNNCKGIIQPQGSINDDKIINFAKKNKLPLYFTKYRFFKH